MSAEPAPAPKYVVLQPPIFVDGRVWLAERAERERLYILLDTLASFAAFYAEPLPDLPPPVHVG